jgi:hypothetical protein
MEGGKKFNFVFLHSAKKSRLFQLDTGEIIEEEAIRK